MLPLDGKFTSNVMRSSGTPVIEYTLLSTGSDVLNKCTKPKCDGGANGEDS
jgi:hypothetical protein